jgi:hypothetical protein
MMESVFGHPSWRIATNDVEAFVTRTGGHLGPVVFDRSNRKIFPFSIAPWWNEDIGPDQPNVLRVLRGDFFCLPFGNNQRSYCGELHPPHGETANAEWRLESCSQNGSRVAIVLSLQPSVREGRVEKTITLIEGHNAVYCMHRISRMSGKMNLGHHAMLKLPEESGSGVLSTSRFEYGQVFTVPLEDAAKGGYSALKPGARITTLDRVPLISGGHTDLRHHPARRGYEDLVQLFSDRELPFAWTAMTYPKQRYVWFSLKNPRILTGTILWLSNGGRHYAPWSGRHVNVIGVEEVTSYFHLGLRESVESNPSTERGYQTSLCFRRDRSYEVPYIMAVAQIPQGFDRVSRIEPDSKHVVLVAASGKRVRAPLCLEMLA